jgi:hypothetical protein
VSKTTRNILIASVVILQLALATFVILKSKQEPPSNKKSPVIEKERTASSDEVGQLGLYKTMLLNETEINASEWRVGEDFFYRYLSQRQAKNLRSFEANPVTDNRFLAFLTRFPLTLLVLYRTHVTGEGLINIGRMPTLEELDIRGIKVTSNNLKGFFGAKHLVKLDARNCGIDDAGMCVLSQNKSYARLTLDANQNISDQGIKCLRDENQLKELSLEMVPITDRSADSLADLVGIEKLSLLGTKISDKSLPYLNRLKQLRSLDLGRTTITDQGLSTLNPPSLKHLLLTGCRKLTSNGLRDFKTRNPGCEVVTGRESAKDWRFQFQEVER